MNSVVVQLAPFDPPCPRETDLVRAGLEDLCEVLSSELGAELLGADVAERGAQMLLDQVAVGREGLGPDLGPGRLLEPDVEELGNGLPAV